MKMKKLTTRLMIATAALVVVAGVASAQVMTASIPFEFRAGSQVMAPGTYQVDRLATQTGIPIYRLLGVDSRRSIALLAQAQVDPKKGWAAGTGKLLFTCTSGSCALAELWSGSESHAYMFRGPKVGGEETAALREIPLQPGKAE
jgi:hypothetical protein